MTYNIYDKKEIKARPSRKKVLLESYIIGKNAPFVLILPGGAYKFISDANEGRPFAEKLNKRGYNAFVLFYSVGTGNARYPYPLKDVARAIEFIKLHAEENEINADKFALMGSSAGGHLASFFAVQYTKFEGEYEGKEYSLKPSALVLSYPVITMGKLTHKTSRDNFLGFLSGKTERTAGSVELQAKEGYPPAFVWHNKDDASVDYRNSVMLKERLDEIGTPCEMHLYESGGHGAGLAEGKDAEGWIDLAADFLDKYLTSNI